MIIETVTTWDVTDVEGFQYTEKDGYVYDTYNKEKIPKKEAIEDALQWLNETNSYDEMGWNNKRINKRFQDFIEKIEEAIQ